MLRSGPGVNDPIFVGRDWLSGPLFIRRIGSIVVRSNTRRTAFFMSNMQEPYVKKSAKI